MALSGDRVLTVFQPGRVGVYDTSLPLDRAVRLLGVDFLVRLARCPRGARFRFEVSASSATLHRWTRTKRYPLTVTPRRTRLYLRHGTHAPIAAPCRSGWERVTGLAPTRATNARLVWLGEIVQ